MSAVEHEDAGPDAFDLLWNRACGFDDPALSSHPGDEALHVALVFEGRVENSGLCEAVGNHAEDPEYPLDRVRAAFALLGLSEAAATIAAAHQELAGSVRDEELLPPGVEERIDAMWPVAGPGLEQAARALLGRCPELFAPVS